MRCECHHIMPATVGSLKKGTRSPASSSISKLRPSPPPLLPLLLLLLLTLSLASITSPTSAAAYSSSSNTNNKRCELITIPLCQNIGYNMTRYPNSYGHERQEEAGLEVHQFYPLVEVNCYSHLKFFLCSMYTPICQEDGWVGELPPCREVCLQARHNCAPLMRQHGFKWPDTLNCDPLPAGSEQETTGRICAAPPDTITSDAVATLSTPRDMSEGEGETDEEEEADSASEDLKHDFDSIDLNRPAVSRKNKKITPPHVVENFSSRGGGPPFGEGSSPDCECRCNPPFHSVFSPAFATPSFAIVATYHERNLSSSSSHLSSSSSSSSNPHHHAAQQYCAHPCRAGGLSSTQWDFLEWWMWVWAWSCFALSTITVLTFLIQPGRFPYPERPILYLSCCQLMVAVGFIVRLLSTHEELVCTSAAGQIGPSQALSTSQPLLLRPPLLGLDSTSASFLATSGGAAKCLATALLVYYFGMAASAWWIVLSFSWVLAAVPHWSTEWISKYSGHFHAFAWLTPAAQTIAVVWFKAIEADSLTGLCYVGATNVHHLRVFVLVPLLIYFTVGAGLLGIGFLNLWSLRSNLKRAHPGSRDKTTKLTQLMSKIGIFSVLYSLPVVFTILALFYEQHYRPLWERAQLCPCAPQFPHSATTGLGLSLVRVASMLVVGWTAGIWILSAKTLQGWGNALCCCFCGGGGNRRSSSGGGGSNGGMMVVNRGKGDATAPLLFPPPLPQRGARGDHHPASTPQGQRCTHQQQHAHFRVNPMEQHLGHMGAIDGQDDMGGCDEFIIPHRGVAMGSGHHHHPTLSASATATPPQTHHPHHHLQHQQQQRYFYTMSHSQHSHHYQPLLSSGGGGGDGGDELLLDGGGSDVGGAYGPRRASGRHQWQQHHRIVEA